MASSSCRARRDLPERRPNIIFLMADDLGWLDVGCYGQRLIRTPNIDRMAAEGIRFTQCSAGAPVCAPARSVLMTGQHSGHTRVRNNFGFVGGVGEQKRVPLLPEDVTVAEVLKGAGYATGITGKWGLGEPGTSGVPNRQGFDEWLGYLNQRQAHSYYPEYIWRNETKLILEKNRDGAQEQYTHDMFTDFALDFIRRHEQEPFFLYVPWCIPHSRLEVPSVEPYENEPWDAKARTFAAMVTRMDRDVGRILDLLDELDIAGETLVFFTSDHGAAERWEGLFDSNGPLRGIKRDVYEGGLRAPMVVRMPGTVPAGRVDDRPWTHYDFLPTAADLAGVEIPDGVDGISVLPTLLGQSQDADERVFYWEIPTKTALQQAVRRGPWKAVRGAVDAPIELYRILDDVSESRNMASQHPDIVEEMHQHMEREHRESPNWPTPRNSRVSNSG